MKKNCLDIGIIQAFLDGEMAQDQTASVSGHIATCDSCALMLADAEDESAIVFSALEREFNTLVPTQRLWQKINDSIAVERDRRPFWEKAWAFLSVGLLTPSMAAAASLLFVIGLASVVWINQGRKPDIVAHVPTVSTPVAPRSIDPIVTPPDAKFASIITTRPTGSCLRAIRLGASNTSVSSHWPTILGSITRAITPNRPVRAPSTPEARRSKARLHSPIDSAFGRR